MTYALRDTVDDVLLGDDHGPRVFENEYLARAAAIVWGTQLGWQDGRIVVMAFDEKGPFSLHSEVECVMSTGDAMAMLGLNDEDTP